MFFSPIELRDYVIKPTLNAIDQWSPEMERLLLGTAATNTHLKDNLGNARLKSFGVYGLTTKAHWDLWDNYLVRNPDLASKIRGFASQRQFLVAPDEELITNLAYATLITWGFYQYQSLKLTPDSKLTDLANDWFTHFQQPLHPHMQHLSPQTFIDAYNRHLSPKHSSLAA